jgi:hypothetical protein
MKYSRSRDILQSCRRRQSPMETMGMATHMGAGPGVMYAAQAAEAFDRFAATSMLVVETTL